MLYHITSRNDVIGFGVPSTVFRRCRYEKPSRNNPTLGYKISVLPTPVRTCPDFTRWKATVVALMDLADVVIMDLRSLKSDNHGCEFELQQLSKRVPPAKIVLIVDHNHSKERKLIDDPLGEVASKVRKIVVESGNISETDAVFDALLEAAGA